MIHVYDLDLQNLIIVGHTHQMPLFLLSGQISVALRKENDTTKLFLLTEATLLIRPHVHCRRDGLVRGLLC